MKRRDRFRIPVRRENRPGIGWVLILTFPGAEVSLHYGDEKPGIIDPMIDLYLEYRTGEDDAQS